MTLLVGALTIGLILSLLALGVYLSFRVFHFPDITADGSITLGASVAAVLAIQDVNPIVGLGVVFLAGMAAGATTGILHTKFGIHGLLSGILVMTALYSVNLHIMGRSNIPLLTSAAQFSAEDMRHPQRLSAALVQAGDPLSQWLLEKLAPDTRRRLQQRGASDPVADDLVHALVRDLNTIIQGGPIFDEQRFAGKPLSSATRELILSDPVGDELLRANRRLLDESYAGMITPHRETLTLPKMAADLADRLGGAYSPLITASEIQQPSVWLAAIREARDPVSEYLRNQLARTTATELKRYDPVIPPSESLLGEVLDDVNGMLQGPLWYESHRFAHVSLSPATRKRCAEDLQGEARVRLNRRLLDEAYPKDIRTFTGTKALPRLNLAGWELDRWDGAQLVGSLAIVVLVGVVLFFFLRTNLGTAMRATGDNPDMMRAQGVNVGNMIVFGLALSNGLVALAGALLAQFQGFADVQLGIGMVVWGLASVIIGEALVRQAGPGLTIVGTVMGSILFRLLLAIALRWGLNPNDLKLVTSLFVFAALVLPEVLNKFRKRSVASYASNS